jgi:hypothetical protein
MGAIPEFSPVGENHLLRSSSVVQHVEYGDRHIRYRTFDEDATEVLRLTFHPSRVTANGVLLRERPDLNEPGWTFDVKTGVVRVRHERAQDIVVRSP